MQSWTNLWRIDNILILAKVSKLMWLNEVPQEKLTTQHAGTASEMTYKTQQQKSWQKYKSAWDWRGKMENVSSKDHFHGCQWQKPSFYANKNRYMIWFSLPYSVTTSYISGLPLPSAAYTRWHLVKVFYAAYWNLSNTAKIYSSF